MYPKRYDIPSTQHIARYIKSILKRVVAVRQVMEDQIVVRDTAKIHLDLGKEQRGERKRKGDKKYRKQSLAFVLFAKSTG